MIEYVKYGTERGRTTAVVTTIESIPEGKIVRKLSGNEITDLESLYREICR